MAVPDVPANLILNERSSYKQYLWLLPGVVYYRWDDRVDYMYAVGATPVEGQGLPPKPPVQPVGSPFNNGQNEYLGKTFIKTVNDQVPDGNGNVSIDVPEPWGFTYDPDEGLYVAENSDPIPAVDASTLQLPDAVRAALAANLADEQAPEGSVLDSVFGNFIAKAASATRNAIMSLLGSLTGHLYATNYGVKADGKTDDTAAMQAFLTDLAQKARIGILPSGTILISAALNIPQRPGWQLNGGGREITVIKQVTDNTPILVLGGVAGPGLHSYALRDIRFDYANTQPAANLTANAVVFAVEAYWATFERLTFVNGSYAMRVAPGVGGPWGSSWNDLTFRKELTLGAMDWSQCINAVPNNQFGRIFVDASNMAGPVFDIRGYAFDISTIEFTMALKGAKLMTFAPNTHVTIGALKLENGIYTTSGQTLIEGQGNADIRIGHMTVTGGYNMSVNTPGGQIYIFTANSGAGSGGQIECDFVEASLTSLTGSAFVSNPGTNARHVKIGAVRLTSWQLQNSNSTAANRTFVEQWANQRISLDRGDSNYTIALGDPNIVIYNTALTAPRSVTLPAVSNNDFNGLIYEIVSAGAVNGSSVINVMNGSTTVATLTADRARVRVAFRRNNAAPLNEWTVLP